MLSRRSEFMSPVPGRGPNASHIALSVAKACNPPSKEVLGVLQYNRTTAVAQDALLVPVEKVHGFYFLLTKF
jgi:hypothetical protein